MVRRVSRHVAVTVFVTTFSLAAPAFAQNSGFSLDMHANGQATAKDIGLPEYPGAVPFQDKDNSGAANLGFALNGFHVGLRVVSYTTSAAPERVLAFYRRPLSRYGEVLECDHGRPVGPLARTHSGLTCSDSQNEHVDVNGSDSSSDHELRAGTPEKYRIVAVDGTDAATRRTKFGLVLLELPKSEGKPSD